MKTGKEIREVMASKAAEVDTLLALGDEITEKQFEEVEELQLENEKLEKRAIAFEKQEKLKAVEAVSGAGAAPIVDSQGKELKTMSKKFNVGTALQKFYQKKLDGVEAEMDQIGKDELAVKGLASSGNESFTIPERLILIGTPEDRHNRDRHNRDVTIGTEGGDIMQTDLTELIPALRINPKVVQAGATVFTNLNGDLQFPRNNGVSTVTWGAEQAALSQSDPTYDNVKLAPTNVGAFSDVSKQALLQSNFPLLPQIISQMERSIEIEFDRAAIEGSGSGSEPTGILNTSGIGDAPGGTDGLAMTWANVVLNESNITSANADFGRLAYMTNGKVVGDMKVTPKGSAGELPVPILPAEVGSMLNGQNLFVSNNVPFDLTKGSGTDLSGLIYGNWEELLMGTWGGVDLLLDPYTQGTTKTMRILMNMFADIKLKHVASFSATQDIIAA